MKKINNLCWCYFHLWWRKYHLCWLYIHLRWQCFLSTSTGENIIFIGVIIICGGENIICVGGKLCILFLSALAKISSALAIFSSVLAKISCALAKISCALAEIACALAEISCALAKISWVVAVFSSVLVGNYVHCKSPTQIFPTKTSPLLALILFRTTNTQLIVVYKLRFTKTKSLTFKWYFFMSIVISDIIMQWGVLCVNLVNTFIMSSTKNQ